MKPFLTAFALFVLAVLLCSEIASAQKPFVYAALTDEGNIAVVDPGSSRLVQRIQVGRDPLDVVLNADLSRLYVSNTGDITVSIVDLAEAREVQVLRLPVNRRGINTGVMIRNWEGTRVYVAERSDDPSRDLRVYVIDTQKENVTAQFDAGKNISAMAVSGDGTKLFVVNKGEGIRVFNTEDNKQVGSVKLLAGFESNVWGIACSPTAALGYVTYGSANKIQVINTANNQQTGVIDVPKYHTGIQKRIIFSPDGKYAFVLNHKDTFKEIDGVNVIDASKNEITKIFNSGVVLNGIAVNHNNKVVYVASNDLKWYSMLTLEHIRSISLRTTIGGIVVVER
ncbi:MAG: YncE family protein [Bacteroidetes bacterium]|nr:YncE family protein [Bacteroidota bacterium]